MLYSIVVVFAIHWNESAMAVHVCPVLDPPPHLPPQPIPQGCPSAPALSALFHASNLDWWSVSHMVIDMFQSCFLKPSHPRLLLTASLKQSSFASACSAQILSNIVLWHSQPCSLPFQIYHITWVTRQPHWDPRHLLNISFLQTLSPPWTLFLIFSCKSISLSSLHFFLQYASGAQYFQSSDPL